MLFSEVYSIYYQTVERLIEKAILQKLDEKTAMELIQQMAFSESFMTILPALKNEQWQIITSSFQTPIQHQPKRPLTILEMQWLKAISQDRRIKLFIEDAPELDNIEPLYKPEDFYYFDQKKNGDQYDSEVYQAAFRKILKGIREKRCLTISFISRKGESRAGVFYPYKLEYSQKDDKFRLLAINSNGSNIINISRITDVVLGMPFSERQVKQFHKEKAVVQLLLTDERNALERGMLHFANYEKVTEKVDNRHYRIELRYPKIDETEVLIRILSFGPMLKVLSPDHFVQLIKQRLKRQWALMQKTSGEGTEQETKKK